MRVNIYNTGITRFLEHLGPGNHMNVEVSPGTLRLLGRTGVKYYPTSADPHMRVATTTNTTVVNAPIAQVVQQPVKIAESTQVNTQPIQKTEKKPQFMRPSDMNGVNNNGVRFGKQVSDAGEVINDSFQSVDEMDSINETTSYEKPQRISAREMNKNYRPQSDDDLDDMKNTQLKDIARQRQLEMEKGLSVNKQPQAVDWDAFDRQYMAEKEAAEKAAKEKEAANKASVVEDIDAALNTFAENGGHFDTEPTAEYEAPVAEPVTEPTFLAQEVSGDVDSLIENMLLQVQTEAPAEVDTGAIYREAMGLDESTTEASAVKKHKGGAPVRTVIIDPEVAKSTVYTKKEMKNMTNKTLASILTGRGYTSGKLRPIPQDSKDKLIAKVLQTQENK